MWSAGGEAGGRATRHARWCKLGNICVPVLSKLELGWKTSVSLYWLYIHQGMLRQLTSYAVGVREAGGLARGLAGGLWLADASLFFLGLEGGMIVFCQRSKGYT